jgi:hypothetical protein
MKRAEKLMQQLGSGAAQIDRADAEAITDLLHADMDRGVRARDASVRAQGHTIACARGCDSCCAQVVVTAEAEAVTIARWLARNKVAREAFLARLPAWEAHPLVGEVAAAARADDTDELRNLATAAMKANLLCPFDDAGACTIYPVRPNLCRKVHALDSAEPCKTNGEALAADFTPIDDFLARARDLEDAMQRALPAAPAHRSPLGLRVATLLAT